jgi:hypothetical protein
MVRARQSRLLAQVLEEILTRYSFLSLYDEAIRCRFPAGGFDASNVPLRQICRWSGNRAQSRFSSLIGCGGPLLGCDTLPRVKSDRTQQHFIQKPVVKSEYSAQNLLDTVARPVAAEQI